MVARHVCDGPEENLFFGRDVVNRKEKFRGYITAAWQRKNPRENNLT